jgi:hypothetical protein
VYGLHRLRKKLGSVKCTGFTGCGRTHQDKGFVSGH